MALKLRDRYDIKVVGTLPAPSEAQIAACETVLGVQFPPGYRQLLEAYHGGKPKPGWYLCNHAVRQEIKRLLSIGAVDPDQDLQSLCLRLRENDGLPGAFVPIAQTGVSSFLLMHCGAEEPGALYDWPDLECGFRRNDPDFDTVFRLYFPVDQLLKKLGPGKDREDVDAHFMRLYWSASNTQNGSKVAEQLVAAGYDINLVLPGFVHPVFAALHGDAFNVAERLIKLGTHRDHLDREGKSITMVLAEYLTWWKDRLDGHPERDTIQGMAHRRIEHIQAALDQLT